MEYCKIWKGNLQVIFLKGIISKFEKVLRIVVIKQKLSGLIEVI